MASGIFIVPILMGVSDADERGFCRTVRSGGKQIARDLTELSGRLGGGAGAAFAAEIYPGVAREVGLTKTFVSLGAKYGPA